MSGWAKDPDTASAINVRLYLDGVLAQTVRASAFRAGVGNYGFDVTLVTTPGTHSVRGVAVNYGGSATSPTIGTRNLAWERTEDIPGVWVNASIVAPRIVVELHDPNLWYQNHQGSYGIERSYRNPDYSSGPWTEVARVPATGMDPNSKSKDWYEPDLSLPSAWYPCYRLVGYTATGSSVPTERMCVEPGPTPPSDARIEYASPGTITVSWMDNSVGELRWDVYSGDMTTWESRQASPNVTLWWGGHPGGGRISATITGLNRGQVYCLTIVNPSWDEWRASFPLTAPCVAADWLS